MGEESKGINFVPIILEVGFDISIPLVVFVILGVWLDEKLKTGHLLLFAGIGLSLISSSMAIYSAYNKIRDKGKEE